MRRFPLLGTQRARSRRISWRAASLWPSKRWNTVQYTIVIRVSALLSTYRAYSESATQAQRPTLPNPSPSPSLRWQAVWSGCYSRNIPKTLSQAARTHSLKMSCSPSAFPAQFVTDLEDPTQDVLCHASSVARHVATSDSLEMEKRSFRTGWRCRGCRCR